MILNQLKTVLLLGLLSGLLLGLGQFFGGSQGLTIMLVIVVMMNLGTYFFSDRLVLSMYRAKEAKRSDYPKLHKLVEECALAADIPKPRVYVIPTETPNAFATGRNPRHAVVAATEGIMRLLNERELKGVIAHEIAHVKNRDILITTIATCIAGAISYLAHFAYFAAIFGGRDDEGSGAEMLVMAILTPIMATLIQLAISRSREYLADERGAALIRNPAALADALQKLERGNRTTPLRHGHASTSSLFIVNPFSGGSIVQWLSTHPPMAERVRRLREMKV